MAAGISITIGANDAASGVLAKVNTGLESLNRRAMAARAPMDRMGTSLGRFGQITGVDRLASDMGGLGRQIGAAGASLGKFAPALGALTSVASIAGLASLVNRWTEFGAKLGLDSQRIGVTSEKLHGFQGAARLAGSSAEAATSGLTSLQDGLTNAAAGRAPQMVAQHRAANRLGRDRHPAPRRSADRALHARGRVGEDAYTRPADRGSPGDVRRLARATAHLARAGGRGAAVTPANL